MLNSEALSSQHVAENEAAWIRINIKLGRYVGFFGWKISDFNNHNDGKGEKSHVLTHYRDIMEEFELRYQM